MVIVTCFQHPESFVKLTQRNVRAFLDKRDLGTGTLFVSERNLCWQERDEIGFSIDYQSISLHAISKDVNVHSEECIYILIDSHINLPGGSPQQVEHNEDSDAESEADVSELILIPEDPILIPRIYEDIKLCQELNPDPEDMDDDDDNLYADAEENMENEYVDARAGGDAVIQDLSRRMEDNFVNMENNYRNGFNNGGPHEEEEDEFEDAD